MNDNMCGLFGWVGNADPKIVEEIVTLAASRGPHSHGYTLLNYGNFYTNKGEGDSKNAIPFLISSNAQACIGHSRLATTGWEGDSLSLEDTMPFVVKNCSIVHNGNVRNYEEISKRFKFKLKTKCDSEIIAHLYDHFSFKSDRCDPLRLTADVIDPSRPYVIVVLDRYGRIVLRRNHLPLYISGIDQAIYICSREFDSAIPIPENVTIYGTRAIGSWVFNRPKEAA